MTALQKLLEKSRFLRSEPITDLPWSVDRDGSIIAKKAPTLTRGGVRFVTEDCDGIRNPFDRDFVIHACNTAEIKDQMIEIMAEALEWVIHPKHDEPDDYTRLACAQHRAFEAMKKVRQLAERALEKV